jgi:cell division protein ZapA
MTPSVRISLQGREYTLRTEEDPDKIQRVVSFVEERIGEMAAGGSVDTRDLTVLTLLNLAGQYLQLLDEQEPLQADDERLKKLAAQVEAAVGNNSSC